MATFAYRFRLHRLKQDDSQAAAARACGVHKNTVFVWESGGNLPRANKMKGVAAYLGIPLEALDAQLNEERKTHAA